MKKIFVIISGIVLLTACSKKSNQELIVGNWNATDVRMMGMNMLGLAFDYYRYDFNADLTGMHYLSSSGNPSQTNFTYTITEDSLFLSLGYDFKILQLDEELLKIQTFLPDTSGNPTIEFKLTMEKQ